MYYMYIYVLYIKRIYFVPQEWIFAPLWQYWPNWEDMWLRYIKKMLGEQRKQWLTAWDHQGGERRKWHLNQVLQGWVRFAVWERKGSGSRRKSSQACVKCLHSTVCSEVYTSTERLGNLKNTNFSTTLDTNWLLGGIKGRYHPLWGEGYIWAEAEECWVIKGRYLVPFNFSLCLRWKDSWVINNRAHFGHISFHHTPRHTSNTIQSKSWNLWLIYNTEPSLYTLKGKKYCWKASSFKSWASNTTLWMIINGRLSQKVDLFSVWVWKYYIQRNTCQFFSQEDRMVFREIRPPWRL